MDQPIGKEPFDGPFIIPEVERVLPEGVKDVDTDPDPFAVSEYVESIFKNMKAREVSMFNFNNTVFRIMCMEFVVYCIESSLFLIETWVSRKLVYMLSKSEMFFSAKEDLIEVSCQ